MSHYFQTKFEDDVYIVRVDGHYYSAAKEIAKGIIVDRLHDVKDFEIEGVTLSSLLNSFHFINGIAQITLVTHP